MNKITIIGNLTRDPTSRVVSTSDGGATVCNFSVAVNERRGGNPVTTFFEVTTWRKRAETCFQYLHKGSKVCVVGPVSIRTYTTQAGENRAQLEVSADEVEFLSPRNEGAQMTPVDSAEAEKVFANAAAPAKAPEPVQERYDDLPF